MSENPAPWTTPEWRAKLADPIGDVIHYKLPALSDEQADAIVKFALDFIIGLLDKK